MKYPESTKQHPKFEGKEEMVLPRQTDWACTLHTLCNGSILSGSNANCAMLWDPVTGTEILQLKGHSNHIRSVSELADGTLVTGSDDQTIKLWNENTGQLLKTIEGHQHYVWSIFPLPVQEHEGNSNNAPDQLLLSGSGDKTCILWNVSKDCRKERVFQGGHSNWIDVVIAVADPEEISKDSQNTDGPLKLMVSGGYDNLINVWSLETGQLLRTLRGHQAAIRCLMQLKRNGTLLSGSNDKFIRQWDLRSSECIWISKKFRGPPTCFCQCPDGTGNEFMTGCYDRNLRIWTNFKKEDPIIVNQQLTSIRDICVLPDRRVCLGLDDGTLRILR